MWHLCNQYLPERAGNSAWAFCPQHADGWAFRIGQDVAGVQRNEYGSSTPARRDDLYHSSRAAVETTYTQALRLCGLRWSRYYGQTETHLQHLLTATALNFLRLGR